MVRKGSVTEVEACTLKVELIEPDVLIIRHCPHDQEEAVGPKAHEDDAKQIRDFLVARFEKKTLLALKEIL